MGAVEPERDRDLGTGRRAAARGRSGGRTASRLTVVAAVVAALVLAGCARPAPSVEVNTPPPTASPTPEPGEPSEPATRRADSVVNLLPTSGVDLDVADGQAVFDQNVRGVDISGSRDGNRIDGMSDGKADMTVLRDTGAETYARCAAVKVFMGTAQDVRLLRAGRNICVRTDEGRLSMLTIERPPTAGDPTMEFRYRTWE